MPLGTSLTSAEKKKIDNFRKKGLSIRYIADKINRSKTVVGNYVKDPQAYGIIRRSGRKKKLSSRQKRTIIRLASNKSISCSQIVSELNLPVTRWCVNKVISESGILKHQKKTASPPLNESNLMKRLNWAKDHMTWNKEWNDVVWSDEKKFNLDGPDGYNYYWHDLRKEKIFSTRRSKGGGSVMIWASFGSKGKSEICFVDGKLNATGYRNVLENHLANCGESIGGSNWKFQQDNAPIHRAKVTIEWFKEQKINVIDWPPYSPDLNPIENLWGLLARRVYSNGKQYTTINELKTAITRCWAEIPQKNIDGLIASMPNRIFDVIRLNGAKTKY
jgi:transposase